ncbi:Threonine/homoserine/homoserine lactone efflux protein [Cognatiyoonia koreensis]|uniref:Threonine/homoserine/homoserine lactone efflux protein n=1 Tax=Cognatiyoonia koreensis TaxID=364200 RepID=A0A1I0RP88_9RHOB|nr:Threonine/homoserine/homoserine lactone efflux protein [Cognatiyoonia koreensis]
MPDTALLLFVFFGLFSPGPNVILLTASGARFGLGPTMPHILGVAIGVGITAGITGLGIGALLDALPALKLGLQIIASVWIIYMAWNLWNANPATQKATDKPFTFVEAVLFQWVNPKVWAVAFSASTFVADLSIPTQMAHLAIAFSGINLGVCFFWTSAGHLLSYLLQNETAWRTFMRIMAFALGVFAIMVFL